MITSHNLELLREKLDNFDKIFLTGATGWIGKETLNLLVRTLGKDFENRVVLFASEKKFCSIGSNTFEVFPLRDIEKHGQADLIIHLAYLKRELSVKLGLSKFIIINREITQTLVDYLMKYPGAVVLLGSSGAVANYKQDVTCDNSMEVYSGLKIETEKIFQSLKSISALVVMRIWSVTGFNPPEGIVYVIQDFIHQAQTTGFVKISGSPNSMRSFIDIQEMMFLYIMEIESRQFKVLDSGGFASTLKQLAELVLQKFDKPLSNLTYETEESNPSIYIPKTFPLNNRATQLGLKMSNLSEQIDNLVLKRE